MAGIIITLLSIQSDMFIIIHYYLQASAAAIVIHQNIILNLA